MIHLSGVSTEIGSKTPTRESFSDDRIRANSSSSGPTHQKLLSALSVPTVADTTTVTTTTLVALHIPHRDESSPSTPALTPGISTTTDDSDTDFQSAYSDSPRASYGGFDGAKARSSSTEAFDGESPKRPRMTENEPGAPVEQIQDELSVPSARERASSTATTILLERPSSYNEETVVPRNRSSRKI